MFIPRRSRKRLLALSELIRLQLNAEEKNKRTAIEVVSVHSVSEAMADWFDWLALCGTVLADLLGIRPWSQFNRMYVCTLGESRGGKQVSNASRQKKKQREKRTKRRGGETNRNQSTWTLDWGHVNLITGRLKSQMYKYVCIARTSTQVKILKRKWSHRRNGYLRVSFCSSSLSFSFNSLRLSPLSSFL